MNDNEPPYLPIEVELSRAVDRLNQEAERVTDWGMVWGSYRRLLRVRKEVKLMARGATLRRAT